MRFITHTNIWDTLTASCSEVSDRSPWRRIPPWYSGRWSRCCDECCYSSCASSGAPPASVVCSHYYKYWMSPCVKLNIFNSNTPGWFDCKTSLSLNFPGKTAWSTDCIGVFLCLPVSESRCSQEIVMSMINSMITLSKQGNQYYRRWTFGQSTRRRDTNKVPQCHPGDARHTFSQTFQTRGQSCSRRWGSRRCSSSSWLARPRPGQRSWLLSSRSSASNWSSQIARPSHGMIRPGSFITALAFSFLSHNNSLKSSLQQK